MGRNGHEKGETFDSQLGRENLTLEEKEKAEIL
jgi:hypothetical protein